MLPLHGVRVLDLGQIWAGPLLGQMLGDMGAEVIAIASARSGMVEVAPNVADAGDFRSYLTWGRNKLRIALNLKSAEGRAIFYDLVQITDVVLDNFDPATAERLGLNSAELRRVNPQVIQVSLSATGKFGPWRDLSTLGPSLSALYGSKSLLRYPDSDQVMEDLADSDASAAVYGLVAVLAALRFRSRTGRGQDIDLAQGEVILAGLAEAILAYQMTGEALRPPGVSHRLMFPYGYFPCRGDDCWVAVSVESDDEWQCLCHAIGRPECSHDRRFADQFARRKNANLVETMIAEWTLHHTAFEATEILRANHVSAYPVQSAAGMFSDPHLGERRLEVELDGSAKTALRPEEAYYGIPMKLRSTPGSIRLPQAQHGEHTRYALQALLGMGLNDIERLEDEEVLK